VPKIYTFRFMVTLGLVRSEGQMSGEECPIFLAVTYTYALDYSCLICSNLPIGDYLGNYYLMGCYNFLPNLSHDRLAFAIPQL